ncbi:hypothetical protein [Paracoccus sphaerophysae]|uniref:hypothetical protein n=1 Tax=Paracoccus sphaerophysae TaxID=690417 RepID=UPI0012EC5EFA|nr:hypothetical protein [Paracoccus sphaerophysae]
MACRWLTIQTMTWLSTIMAPGLQMELPQVKRRRCPPISPMGRAAMIDGIAGSKTATAR